MNWASYKPEEFEGESYGQKDIEFKNFMHLPSLTNEKFVLAMGQGPEETAPPPTWSHSGGGSSSRTSTCRTTPATMIS